MKRTIQVLAVAAAILGAFMLGRFTAKPSMEAGGMAISAADAGAEAVGVDDGGPAGAVAQQTGEDASSRQSARGTPPGDAAAPASAPMEMAGAEAGGPQPLRQEDMPQLAKAEARLAAEGGTWRDLLDLAANEERDADARRLEQLIAQSILRLGGRYTLLRLAPPHCTRTVCLLRGVGGGRGDDPRSDWQGLSRAIMNEAWFREHFDDMRTSVGSEGGNTVYVTLFVRCEPGACRFGRR